jgi:GDPmannose 4,6-dehydratase
MIRRSSRGLDLGCASGLVDNPNLEIVEGDLTDLSGIERLCKQARPDHLYNTAAMSHVGTSFEMPIYTGQVTGLGVLNCLEAIRLSGIHTRFVQFSTSEMFGGMDSSLCNEESAFHPRSPYGVAKLYGYWITRNYREAYKLFASNVIMFNHEMEGKRGPNFVTRKIAIAVARISKGLQDKLYLGNLDAKRDWGHAADYMNAVQRVMTANEPDDFVVATGETHSVREFCDLAFKQVELDYKDHVEVDPRFYRPAEVDVLLGDATKIREKLGWKPAVKFPELVKRMVDYEVDLLDN